MTRKLAALLAITSLTACDLSPELENVLPSLPQAFKEAPKAPLVSEPVADANETMGSWKTAEPADDKDKGKWWTVFEDEDLNALEEQAMAGNLSLQAAAARVTQARALADVESAGLWPSVGIDGSAARNETTNSNFPGATTPRNPPQNFYSLKGSVAYAPDLFGKAANRTLAAELLADAEDASYKNMVLLLQADVAQTYYTLRSLDEQIRVLRESVAVDEEAEALMQKRVDAGTNSSFDLMLITGELAATRAQLLGLQNTRINTEHAMAVLLGKAPAEFTWAGAPLQRDEQPPTIPAGLPSSLLERRPDVAAAQRKFASANAGIGAARAAFFPSIALSATGGVESAQLGELFQWSARAWSIGPSISIPIFEGGKNFANLDRVHAVYDEAVAGYKQQLLLAFREVEDSLVDVRLLSQQQAAAHVAASSAAEAARLSTLRYEQGDLNYLDTRLVRKAALEAARAHASVRGARYVATAQLIRALGGGWE